MDRSKLLAVTKITTSILLTVGTMSVILLYLKNVPDYLLPAPAQTYNTIEEASRATGVLFYTPAYYPDYLRWPPYEIRGWIEPQKKIGIAVIMQDSERSVLWLEEWNVTSSEATPSSYAMGQIIETKYVSLRDDMHAQMVVFENNGNQISYQLIWNQGDTRIAMTALLPPSELLRMAGNMQPIDTY